MTILSRAPCRISLFGGGCDFPDFYEKNGCTIISMAINIYQTVTLYTGDDVYGVPKNQFTGQDDPLFFYDIAEHFEMNSGHFVRYQHTFDGITESGLGSSGALSVALTAAFMRATEGGGSIAHEAWKMENDIIGHKTGIHDHLASSFGGLQLYRIWKITTSASRITSDISRYILLFHTGIARVKTEFPSGNNHLIKIKELADEAVSAVYKPDFPRLADLLRESWELKRLTHGIPEKVDELYAYGIKCGAMAGKLLGSGGGGYMIFMVEPNRQKQFIADMKKKGLTWYDYAIDYNGVTVRILP
mgnify:FL=1